jgi:lipid-A-disaccharide synthase
MKYYIIAGEASGDLHGSNLIKEIFKQDREAQIRCWGGDLMQQAGRISFHYKERALWALRSKTFLPFDFIKTCKQTLQIQT